MRNVLVFGSLALVAMVWTGAAAQQEMRPRPGPGSGVTPISGSVGVTSLPPVDAKQSGEWRVEITDLPEVRVAGPSFVGKGRRYKITWTNGDGVPHTATYKDNPTCTTERLGQGESGGLTFSAAGTYAFFCQVHTDMTGTIEVTS